MEKSFELNPYDKCVMNKIVNVKQCTLLWYMEYNKVLYKEEKVVEDLIINLKKHFGELVVTIGKKNIFLGMNKNITEEKMLR